MNRLNGVLLLFFILCSPFMYGAMAPYSGGSGGSPSVYRLSKPEQKSLATAEAYLERGTPQHRQIVYDSVGHVRRCIETADELIRNSIFLAGLQNTGVGYGSTSEGQRFPINEVVLGPLPFGLITLPKGHKMQSMSGKEVSLLEESKVVLQVPETDPSLVSVTLQTAKEFKGSQKQFKEYVDTILATEKDSRIRSIVQTALHAHTATKLHEIINQGIENQQRANRQLQLEGLPYNQDIPQWLKRLYVMDAHMVDLGVPSFMNNEIRTHLQHGQHIIKRFLGLVADEYEQLYEKASRSLGHPYDSTKAFSTYFADGILDAPIALLEDESDICSAAPQAVPKLVKMGQKAKVAPVVSPEEIDAARKAREELLREEERGAKKPGKKKSKLGAAPALHAPQTDPKPGAASQGIPAAKPTVERSTVAKVASRWPVEHVPKKSLVAENGWHMVEEAVPSVHYSRRIEERYLATQTQEADMDVGYHDFPLGLDPYIVKYGEQKRRPNATYAGIIDIQYILLGMVKCPDGSFKYVVYMITQGGVDGRIYHRQQKEVAQSTDLYGKYKERIIFPLMTDDISACIDGRQEPLDTTQGAEYYRRFVIEKDAYTVRATDIERNRTHIVFKPAQKPVQLDRFATLG